MRKGWTRKWPSSPRRGAFTLTELLVVIVIISIIITLILVAAAEAQRRAQEAQHPVADCQAGAARSTTGSMRSCRPGPTRPVLNPDTEPGDEPQLRHLQSPPRSPATRTWPAFTRPTSRTTRGSSTSRAARSGRGTTSSSASCPTFSSCRPTLPEPAITP